MSRVGENLSNPRHCVPVVVDTTAGGVLLAAANPNRGQFLAYSDAGNVVIRIALDAAAGATRYTVIMRPSATEGAYYEMPTFGNQVYTGPVYAIADSGSGTIEVTELAKP